MSELILPPGMASEMPNLGEREQAQWWAGKATRREVEVQLQAIRTRLDKELHSVAKMMSSVYSMARVNGLQAETMVRMMEKAVSGYDEKFDEEFKKTLALIGFLDTINPPGEHSQKPIKERIQMVRDWNAIEDGVKAKGEQFSLDTYIMRNQKEFTPEEVADLSVGFSMKLPEMPPVIEVQEAVRHEQSAKAVVDASSASDAVLTPEQSKDTEVENVK